MTNKSTKVLNILISFGFLFLLSVLIVAFVKEDLISTSSIITTSLLLQILLGSFITTLSIYSTKKAYQLFLGLLISVYGVLLYVMHFILPYTIYEMWPVFLVCAGIILFVTGMYKYKMFKYGFGIPALVLFCMGIWFSLFSFKIFKISFKIIVEVAGPLFLLAAAAILIAFFFIQQKHSELVVKDDIQGDFEDEEMGHLKNGK